MFWLREFARRGRLLVAPGPSKTNSDASTASLNIRLSHSVYGKASSYVYRLLCFCVRCAVWKDPWQQPHQHSCSCVSSLIQLGSETCRGSIIQHLHTANLRSSYYRMDRTQHPSALAQPAVIETAMLNRTSSSSQNASGISSHVTTGQLSSDLAHK